MAKIKIATARGREVTASSLGDFGVGSWAWDIDGGRVHWSAELSAIYGLTPEPRNDLSVEDFSQILHSNDRARVLAFVSETLATRRPAHEVRFRIVRPDGGIRHILSRAQLTLDRKGQPQTLSGIDIDVTSEAGSVETALLDSGAFSRCVIESSPDCLKVIDLEGNLVLMNAQGQRLMEIDDFASCKGQQWAGLWPGASRQQVSSAVSKALAGDETRFEAFCPTAKGTPKWWDVTVSPGYGNTGKVVSILAISRDITEQKDNQERLRDNEERFRVGLAVSGLGVASIDYEANTITLDTRAAAIYDLPANTPIARHEVHARFHPSDSADLQQRIAELLEKQEDSFMAVEHRIVVTTGEIRWLNVRKQIATALGRNGSRRPKSGILAVQDITDRKRAEETSRQSRELVESILAAAPVSIYIFNIETARNELINARARELLGYDERGWAQKVTNAVELMHLDDQARLPAHFNELCGANSLAVMQFEYRMRHADGSWKWFLSRDQVYERGPDGKVLKVLGTATDITERKQAEEQLAASVERLQAAEEAAGGLIYDASGSNVWRSDGLTRMLGWRQDEVTRTAAGWRDLWHPEDAARLDREVREAPLGPDSLYSVEYRVRHKDGHYVWVWDRGRAIQDAQGNVLRMVGTTIDISAQKRREANYALLAELGESFAKLTSVKDIADAAIEKIRQHFNAARCLLLEIDAAQTHGTVFRETFGENLASLIGTYRISDFHMPDEQQRLLGGRPVVINNVEGNERSYEMALRYAALGIGAVINAPYVSNGVLKFVLSITKAHPCVWAKDEVELVQEIAERLYLRLDRARTEEALRAAHDTFRHIIDHSPFGLYVVDADFRLSHVSDGAQKVFETVRPLIGRDFAEVLRILWPEPFASEAIAIFRKTLETGEPYHAPSTVERRHDIGEVESYDWKTERITLPDGRFGVVCHFYDLSERQRYEERQKMLLNELNHRVKNTLATIQSIAAQTFRNSPDLDQARESFSARLMSLAKAHDILTRESWDSAPLTEIVEKATAPYRGDRGDRFSIEGPPLRVAPRFTLALTMALHELCTNAVKYGALSNETGKVNVKWNVESSNGTRRLKLYWSETNGPPVAPPARRGFGSRLIERGLAQDLGGEVKIDFAPKGVNCEVLAKLP